MLNQRALAGLCFAFLCLGCGDKFSRIPDDNLARIVFKSEHPQNFNLLNYFASEHLTDPDNEFGILTIPASGSIVYAQNTMNYYNKGRYFLGGGSSSGTWTIPSGSYYFFLIGYDSANMSGNVLCARGGDSSSLSTYSLEGGKTYDINFTPSTPNCSGDPFGSTQSSYSLTVAICTKSDGTAINFNHTSTTVTTACNASHLGGAAETSIGCLMYGITKGDEFNYTQPSNSTPTGLLSSAITVTSGVSSAITTPILLGGGTSTIGRLTTEVALFTNTDCSGGPAAVYAFEKGFLAADNSWSGEVKRNSPTYGYSDVSTKVFLKTNSPDNGTRRLFLQYN